MVNYISVTCVWLLDLQGFLFSSFILCVWTFVCLILFSFYVLNLKLLQTKSMPCRDRVFEHCIILIFLIFYPTELLYLISILFIFKVILDDE